MTSVSLCYGYTFLVKRLLAHIYITPLCKVWLKNSKDSCIVKLSLERIILYISIGSWILSYLLNQYLYTGLSMNSGIVNERFMTGPLTKSFAIIELTTLHAISRDQVFSRWRILSPIYIFGEMSRELTRRDERIHHTLVFGRSRDVLPRM